MGQANGICTSASETCNDAKKNQGETGIDCGGPCPNPCNLQIYELVKSGSQCNSENVDLGRIYSSQYSDLPKECAKRCKANPKCKFFIYGVTFCFWEKTSSASCPEGWNDNAEYKDQRTVKYDFYQLRETCQDNRRNQ